MLADKPAELSRIKLKTWARQPVPMISEHSANLTPLSVDFSTWRWRYTYLLLLILMLWHRQATFKSKRDKLSSSAESRIWTRDPNTKSPADWMLADKPTELSRIKLKTWTRQPVPMISEPPIKHDYTGQWLLILIWFWWQWLCKDKCNIRIVLPLMNTQWSHFTSCQNIIYHQFDTRSVWILNVFFFSTKLPRQNGRHFADTIFKSLFLQLNKKTVSATPNTLRISWSR